MMKFFIASGEEDELDLAIRYAEEQWQELLVDSGGLLKVVSVVVTQTATYILGSFDSDGDPQVWFGVTITTGYEELNPLEAIVAPRDDT